jgi:hypothetical protein
MPDLFISVEQAENDVLACAAFVAERIKSGTGHAEAMNAVIPRFLARGEVDLAAELANAIDDPFSRDKLLILIAAKCAELDDDEYALQLTEAIEDHGMQAEALERVALIKAGKGDVDKASKIAESMLHPEFVLAGIAVQQASNGEQTAAEATLARIEYANARVSALQQIARNEMAAGETERTLTTLEQAASAAREIEHDEERIRALCDIGTMFTEAGDNAKTVATFDEAQAAAELLDNIHRDFSLVNCALGFLYAGDEAKADAALDLVTDKTQMSSALLGFARSYWDGDRKDDAVDTLQEAYEILKSQRDFETRDSRARNALMASIAAQFAAFEKADRGIEIALESADHEDKMAALAQIAQIQTLQKQDDLARQTINMMEEDADRLFALVGLADAKKKIGDESGSVTLLDEAAELAETVPQLAARSNVLNGVAFRYAEHGQPQKAHEVCLQNLEIISEIRDESSQSEALAKLSESFTIADVELSDAARQIIDGMIRRADRPG